jgi:hypothetical protein
MEREFRRCVLEAKAAGQAVFLSSHILSEVEALCDRVAILRAGRLVEAGTLADMRHLSALSVEALFTAAPPDLSAVPGVSDIETDGDRVRLQVRGPVALLLERLATARVTQLLSREPSLEELFLAQYGAEPEARVRELAPRFAVTAGYAIVVWAFLVEIIGASLGVSRWLLDLSVLHHVARAPAVPVGWGSAAILTAIGIAAAIAGAAAFARRDLAGT